MIGFVRSVQLFVHILADNAHFNVQLLLRYEHLIVQTWGALKQTQTLYLQIITCRQSRKNLSQQH
jgi:hypothetical protein